MGRPLRIEYSGAWYHVMNRGLARKNIVKCDNDCRLFLKLLGETSQIHSIEVHAYSLMNNHYHLLIHTPQAGLSKAMKYLNGVYTRKVNYWWHSDGPLFRGRYKAILVDSEEYLLELIRYIHLNPVEARLCDHPEDHAWTSHRCYLKQSQRPLWLVTEEILSRFGNKEGKSAFQFDRFVKAGVSHTFRDVLKKSRVILGEKGFQEWVYKNFVDQKKAETGTPIIDRTPRFQISKREILRQIAHAYNVPLSEIRKVQPGRRNDSRAMAVYLLRHLTGSSQKEIARWLGAPNVMAVAKMHQRFKEKLERDRKLERLTQVVADSIRNRF